MKLPLPIPVDQIISQCVGSVSQRILPQLQAANSNIQALSFMVGHPLELKNRLIEMTNSKTQKYLKFPTVMLFSDIIKSPSSVKGAYHDVTLNIVIAMSTEPTALYAKRDIMNFQPILRPIYQELIEEIARCGYFWVQSPRQLLGRDIERFYWGREGLQGNEANQFNDYIDAIEIKNLKLTQSKKGTALVQNTFTQMLEYFLSQTRAEITIGTVTDNTIVNAFFKNSVTQITTDFQAYLSGIDFTQDLTAGSITGINIQFSTGQIIRAER